MGDVRVPDGVRAGQLSVLTLGRVIMGDIGVTMVDLAIRKLARVEEAQDGDWLVSPLLALGDAPASFGKNDGARPVRTGAVISRAWCLPGPGGADRG